jgi:hypothetical protein
MANETKKHELTLKANQGETKGGVIAGRVFQRGLNSAVLVAEYNGGLYGKEVSLEDWFLGVGLSIKLLQGNDLRDVEATLTGQMMALDAIFTKLARQALQSNIVPHIETFTRLAMKAQNQSRATAQTLASIKQPRQAVFMKQANIANGPQQVNNNINQQPQSQASNGEGNPPTSPNNFKTEQNELLKANEEIDRLDTGTPGKAGGNDSEVEAVGSVNRAKNRGRKSNSCSKRL